MHTRPMRDVWTLEINGGRWKGSGLAGRITGHWPVRPTHVACHYNSLPWSHRRDGVNLALSAVFVPSSGGTHADVGAMENAGLENVGPNSGVGKTIGPGENPSDSCIFIATDVDKRAFCEVSLPAVA